MNKLFQSSPLFYSFQFPFNSYSFRSCFIFFPPFKLPRNISSWWTDFYLDYAFLIFLQGFQSVQYNIFCSLSFYYINKEHNLLSSALVPKNRKSPIFRFFEDPRHAMRDGTNCATPRFVCRSLGDGILITSAKIINNSDYAKMSCYMYRWINYFMFIGYI